MVFPRSTTNRQPLAEHSRCGVARRGQAADRNGAAAVEFALLLPILLLVLLWCADFGRVWHHRILLTNAAKFGAQTAVARPIPIVNRDDWQMMIESKVQRELTSLSDGVPPQVKVRLSDPLADRPAWVEVHVEYIFQTLVPWPGIPEQVKLSETAVSPNVH